jgi:cell division initiation protein
MDVSPKTLREVEFREKMRGYHPEDVDHFLEQVAAGLEVLQDRLRQAVDRAQRAEAAASEVGPADDTLRKTLVLAQRTADLAVQEAREQAARILAGAEQQAQAMIADAEERGRRTYEDAVADSRAELQRLESARTKAAHEVEGLERWVDEHRTHLLATLSDAVSAVERGGLLWPAPTGRSIDAPGPLTSGRNPAVVAPPPPADPTGNEPVDPPTAAWNPAEDLADDPAPASEPINLDRSDEPPDDLVNLVDAPLGHPDDQALDEFFDDNGELVDDRRFGSRLRRRR